MTTTTDRTKYCCETTQRERAHDVLGVPGRLSNLVRHASTEPNQRIRNQKWISKRRDIPNSVGETLQVVIRHDDELLNGHPSFSITGDTYNSLGRNIGGGCCHDLIAEVFPELAPLIKWHLCSTDGPMHYVANTLYHAEQHGANKGWVYFTEPITKQEICLVYCSGNEWMEKFADKTNQGYEFRLDPKTEKVANFDYARSSAAWPGATDAQLSAGPKVLKKMLLARLPKVLAEFRHDVESIGFEWE